MRTFISILSLAAVATLGCNSNEQSSIPVPVETTQATFNTAGNPTVEINTQGLHCEVCEAGACKILADVPGVVEVQANNKTKKITVAIDESEFDADTAISALHDDSRFGDSEVVDDTQGIDAEEDTAKDS